jgi:hypothetical protein
MQIGLTEVLSLNFPIKIYFTQSQWREVCVARF